MKEGIRRSVISERLSMASVSVEAGMEQLGIVQHLIPERVL
jgi:hypothetical protein